VFHFKDGSVHDETAAFSQRRTHRMARRPIRKAASTHPCLDPRR
jgi:hypothetical protein